MATSGSFSKYPVDNFGLYCTWSASQSVIGNYSDVTLNVYLKPMISEFCILILILILTEEASAVRVETLSTVEPPRVLADTALEDPYTWLDFFLARTLTE